MRVEQLASIRYFENKLNGVRLTWQNTVECEIEENPCGYFKASTQKTPIPIQSSL